MYIKSKTEISINLSMTETVSTKIMGFINSIEIAHDFQKIVVRYSYKTEDNRNIKTDVIILVGEEIDNVRNDVQNHLPEGYSDMNEREKTMYKYLTGFTLLMSQTFNINIDDIEIILEE